MNVAEVKLIDILIHSQNNLNLVELVHLSGLPKTTVHRNLNNLVQAKLLFKINNQYGVGPILQRWISNGFRQQDFYRFLHPFLEGINHQFNEVVHLILYQNQSAIYVDKVLNTGALTFQSNIGDELCLYSSSAGRAILMLMSEEEREHYFNNNNFKKRTPYTITDPAALKEEIQLSLERGYAREIQQNELNVQCIGVSFFLGPLKFAISISTTILSSEEKIATMAQELLHQKQLIEERFSII